MPKPGRRPCAEAWGRGARHQPPGRSSAGVRGHWPPHARRRQGGPAGGACRFHGFPPPPNPGPGPWPGACIGKVLLRGVWYAALHASRPPWPPMDRGAQGSAPAWACEGQCGWGGARWPWGSGWGCVVGAVPCHSLHPALGGPLASGAQPSPRTSPKALGGFSPRSPCQHVMELRATLPPWPRAATGHLLLGAPRLSRGTPSLASTGRSPKGADSSPLWGGWEDTGRGQPLCAKQHLACFRPGRTLPGEPGRAGVGVEGAGGGRGPGPLGSRWGSLLCSGAPSLLHHTPTHQGLLPCRPSPPLPSPSNPTPVLLVASLCPTLLQLGPRACQEPAVG